MPATRTRNRWTVSYDENGVLYIPDGSGVLDGDVLEAVVAQWADEGYATPNGQDWLMGWDAVYDMLDGQAYQDIAGQAGIPPVVEMAPRLVSRGALSDTDFTIAIAGWHRPDGQPVDRVSLQGAVVLGSGPPALLTRQVWSLVSEVRAFAARAADARDSRTQRLAWGTIRRMALAAGARLDDFLFRSVVLAPERLRIQLRKAEVEGDKVVEVSPEFDGHPEGWLSAFDRSSRVQDRYDIATGAGIVQVVIAPDVKVVLEQIKRMPGRRVAGSRAEAFVANPFATLGESAAKVIDATEFEQARAAAGLTLDHFTAFVESDERGLPSAIGILVETSTGTEARSDKVLFRDDNETEKFVRAVQGRLDRRLQVCPWNGFEFELLGDTPDQLRILQAAVDARRRPRLASVLPAAVYDLTRYSERIEGIGVEKPYASLYIAKKNDDQGWFPDNAIFLVGAAGGGDPVPLGEADVRGVEQEIQRARDSGQTTVRIPGVPDPVPVEAAERLVRGFRTAEADLKRGQFDPTTERTKRPLRKSLLIKPNISSVDYLEQRRDLLMNVSVPAVRPAALKADVKLKEHQVDGLAWLQHLYSQSPDHCRGAVLADDMGLGKTLQLLCMIASTREADRSTPPALVVAPVALLENWREEVARFFEPGTLTVNEVYGDTLAAHRLPASEIDAQLRADGLVRFLRPGWVGNADIVLTTYETLRDHEFSFAAEKWSFIICDEAQKIKNPNALVTRAAKKQNARFRVACTGTPVENTLADLWCLFDFVQPGYLGALNEFGRKYRRPIEARTDEERARVEELRSLIAPQIKRRLKRDVARDLPQKIENQECKQLALSETQRSLYAQAIGQFSRRQEPGAVTPFKNALGLLHYLRVVCTDPQPYGLTTFRAEPVDEYRAKAPKLGWLVENLAEIRRRDEKALIFCEFRDMQRLIRHYVAEVFGHEADIINGDTSADSRSAESRQKRIAAFQKSPGFGVIILSPLAVGFGVNIQAANHVIHYTRTWNPAKEDQATDRAYRIGQTRDVHVYCPVVRAPDFVTFDEKLDRLLALKRALAEDMLNGAGDVGPSEFDIGEVAPPGVTAKESKTLDLVEIDRMSPRYFEAYVAALWQRRGFDAVTLTPSAGDGGVDVVGVRDGSSGELVQCKSSSRAGGELGWEAIKDVVTGEAAYKARHPGVAFVKVCVTNQYFNGKAREQAAHNDVRLVNREELEKLAAEYPLTLVDVERVLYPDWGSKG